MSPETDEGWKLPVLKQRLECLVDELSPDSDEHIRKFGKPRFVHAVLVLADPGANKGEILKTTLIKSLDPNWMEIKKETALVEKRRIQEKIEFFEDAERQKIQKKQQKEANCENGRSNGRDGGEFCADPIAEAVRVLREAREMLEEKLRKIGAFGPGEMAEYRTPTMASMERTGSNPPPRQQQQCAATSPAILPGRPQHQQRLLSTGLSFPSELRKYRSITMMGAVNS